MGVQYIMSNGEVVPVPREISSQGVAAEAAFYDTQVARLKVEAEPAVAPASPVSEGSQA